MRRILHILTQSDDSLPQAVIRVQSERPDHVVRAVDLTAPEPDYKELLREIFEADSVEVW